MRFLSMIMIVTMVCSYSCNKKNEHQFSAGVQFEQKKFEEALVLAAQQKKVLMVDFWSAG